MEGCVWRRTVRALMALRCFDTYCFTGVHTGQELLLHFWWCFSSSLLATHLRTAGGSPCTECSERVVAALTQPGAALPGGDWWAARDRRLSQQR